MSASDPVIPARGDDEGTLRRRTATWLALGLFALPFTQTLEWDFERCAPLVLVLPALWSGRGVLTRALARVRAAPRWLRALFLIANVLGALGAIASHRPSAAITIASWGLTLTAALIAGQIVAEERALGRRLLGALALSAALATAAHWLRWKTGADPQTAFYPHFRLMGLHSLGAALATTVLVATASDLGQRLAWGLAGAVVWGGLFWSGSRTPVIGVGAGLLVLVALGGRGSRRSTALTALALLAAGLALSFVLRVPQSNLGVSGVLERSLGASSMQEFTSNRSVFWTQGWQRFLERPWLGYGPDAYRFLEPKLEGAQPHNLVLQWLIDLGIPVTLFLVLATALTLRRALRRLRGSAEIAAWPALAIASLVAAQLDGFFYHQIALATAAIACGVCAAASDASSSPVKGACWRTRLFVLYPQLILAAALAWHAWLFHAVRLAPPPAPDAFTARAWRAFPTTTFGLERWIEAWTPTHSDAALALSRIAQEQSPNGDFFHVQTAGLLWQRGDREGARRELATAHAIASPRLRPVIEQLQRQTEVPVSRR